MRWNTKKQKRTNYEQSTTYTHGDIWKGYHPVCSRRLATLKTDFQMNKWELPLLGKTDMHATRVNKYGPVLFSVQGDEYFGGGANVI